MIKQINEFLKMQNINATIINSVDSVRIKKITLTADSFADFKKMKNLQDELSFFLKTECIIETDENFNINVQIQKKVADEMPDFNFKQLKLSQKSIPILAGLTIDNKFKIIDLAKCPHLLVAGTTGSGKSVLLHQIILSIIQKSNNKLILIDAKKVEFGIYNCIKNLAFNIIDEVKTAVDVLNIAITEMEQRYKLFEEKKARNIDEYNQIADKFGKKDNVIIIIDEYADLVLVDKSIEKLIVRLCQKSRAAGIHIILCTQKISSEIVSSLIKSNIDSRIALKTANAIDSRQILNRSGAEKLAGQGDLFLLYKNKIDRLQSIYLTNEQILETIKNDIITENDYLKNKNADGTNTYCWTSLFKTYVKTTSEKMNIQQLHQTAIDYKLNNNQILFETDLNISYS
jgi:S-DNA-T family DNA segregation ATPase FtsK/SpoIIIE